MSVDTIWDEYPYQVLDSRLVTPVIRELSLTPSLATLGYSAGQYVLLNDGELPLPPRSYSVANASRPDGAISLLVTRVPGGDTSSWCTTSSRSATPWC